MPDKYLEVNSGNVQEKAAIDSSAGAGDAGKIPALDSSGRLSNSMMPSGVGADSKIIEASETLAAGDLVNIHDSTGEKVRKADASNGRAADGFVLAAVTSGQTGEVFFDGTITGLSGLTPGTKMFLSPTTAGAATATAPTAGGETSQKIGKALSATEISFEPGEPILLAT